MKKEKILEDKNLETIGLIKEIDTLSIIINADCLREKRKLNYKNITVLIISLLILLFNLFFIVLGGIKIFILVQILFSWIIPILFIPLLKKKFTLEV